MNNPMITDALLDGRSIIVVGHAPLDSKVTAFQSLVDALANKRKLGVIDEHHVLPTVPPSATVIDADGKGVDAIHHTIREDNITAVAFPTMRRGMDYAGQENGQVLMINEGMPDAVQTLRGDLPMMLLKSSPSGHTEFSDAAIKAMDPVVVTLDRNGNVESIITVDKHAEGIVAMPMQ